MASSSARIGVFLSSEEHGPSDIVRHGAAAVEHGFTDLSVSDHYHPWIEAQGNSPFVWGVLGGLAVAAPEARLGTGVTCPTMRIHPAVVAQAAATAALMAGGGFFLGVGTGELAQELRTPAIFEQASEMVDEDAAVGPMPVGPDPERHVASLRTYLEAGADEIHVQQIGPAQAEAFRFYRDEVLPRL